MQKFKSEELNKIQSDINKMKLYLLPRMLYINDTGLVIASQTAQADVSKAANESKECITSCGVYNFDCIDKCPITETMKHLESCESITFLPC